MATHYDVVIIGGGPAGSTCGTLLAKYNPRLKVAVFERERFPRDHVGESQLPLIGRVLFEMGVWDKVERCGFPIKIGATYRWGATEDLWDFEFVPNGAFQDESRPARYTGQRTLTAFQVDRAIYDEVLLEHARETGCIVRQETAVRQIRREGDRVTSMVLDDGSEVTAKYYVDASGHTGVLRRAMGVETESPTALQNIAIWDYWRNAEWAVSIGVGGTRVQVLSQGYGWVWFIPLGPDRTSVGLIVPAAYYRESGKKPRELYDAALETDPILRSLLANATREEKLATTKDWSFLAERLVGENWFLAGESAGFADPILAAGMTLAHMGARDVAYTILALERGDYEPDWLRRRYDESHRRHIRQHIRFADFWYTHNGVFTDLQEHTATIAKEAGIDLDPLRAWQWLGTGGFVDEETRSGIGGYNLASVKVISDEFLGVQNTWSIAGVNVFRPNLEGATKGWSAQLEDGRITRYRRYERDGRVLPTNGPAGFLLRVLKEDPSLERLFSAMDNVGATLGLDDGAFARFVSEHFEVLEAMANDGWVTLETEDGKPTLPQERVDLSPWLHRNRDVALRISEAASV